MKNSTIDKTKTKLRNGIIICAIAVVVLAATGAAAYYFTSGPCTLNENNAVQTYEVTDAGGILRKLTIAEMNKELNVKTIYPGIKVNGVDVSGKTKEEATALLAG